jgi:hypothetical protein
LEVEELSATVADEEQHVQGLEAEGLDHEQVGGPKGACVVDEEGAPALARWSGVGRRR